MPSIPVLLIHGLKDDSRKMRRLERHLREAGREVHSLDVLPSWGQVGLDVLAEKIVAFVGQTFAPEQRFDLVGYSMGGLVCRYYLQRLGGLERVRRFITIAAPHRGSVLAWLVPNAGGRQMRPGSAFLRDLESDADRLKQVGFTSLWTPFDLIIVPFRSSIVSYAKNLRLWCIAHPLMVYQRCALRAVEAALA
jgi:triacylglycerol lipase